jgi:hypothetical protein
VQNYVNVIVVVDGMHSACEAAKRGGKTCHRERLRGLITLIGEPWRVYGLGLKGAVGSVVGGVRGARRREGS